MLYQQIINNKNYKKEQSQYWITKSKGAIRDSKKLIVMYIAYLVPINYSFFFCACFDILYLIVFF